MADGSLTGSGLEAAAMAPERTGWAAEQEPASLEKGELSMPGQRCRL